MICTQREAQAFKLTDPDDDMVLKYECLQVVGIFLIYCYYYIVI